MYNKTNIVKRSSFSVSKQCSVKVSTFDLKSSILTTEAAISFNIVSIVDLSLFASCLALFCDLNLFMEGEHGNTFSYCRQRAVLEFSHACLTSTCRNLALQRETRYVTKTPKHHQGWRLEPLRANLLTFCFRLRRL